MHDETLTPRLATHLGQLAAWLATHHTSPATLALLRAVEGRDPQVGLVLAEALAALPPTARAALARAPFADAVALAGVESVHWPPSSSAAKARRRLERLNAIAREQGYPGWRALETALINGRARLRLERREG